MDVLNRKRTRTGDGPVRKRFGNFIQSTQKTQSNEFIIGSDSSHTSVEKITDPDDDEKLKRPGSRILRMKNT